MALTTVKADTAAQVISEFSKSKTKIGETLQDVEVSDVKAKITTPPRAVSF
jgi:hypothetical protein